MYELSVRGKFSSAHRLCRYEGKCSRLHGHNWGVEVFLRSEQLSEAGMVIDFGEFKGILNGILEELDHRCLNDIAPFDGVNPTSENLASWLYRRMRDELSDMPHIRVSKVTVEESEGVKASYWEEQKEHI